MRWDASPLPHFINKPSPRGSASQGAETVQFGAEPVRVVENTARIFATAQAAVEVRAGEISRPRLRVPPVPRFWGTGMKAPRCPDFSVGVTSQCMKGERIRGA
jgi:hypothetical protein